MKKKFVLREAIILRIKKRRRKITLGRSDKKKTSGIDDSHQTIDAPKNFSFSEAPKECLDFVKNLRDATLKKAKFLMRGRKRSRGLYVNLSAIEKISMPAAIVLAAELDRWRINSGIKLQTKDLDQWDEVVVKTLNQLGFFALLDVENTDFKDITNINVLKLESNDRSDGAFVEKFLSEIEKHLNVTLPSSPGRTRNYEGLQEAIENSVSHAYQGSNSTEYPWVRQHWLTASKDEDNMTVKIFIYDQGIGIPKSILQSKDNYNKNIISRVKSKFSSPSDGQIIEAAFEIGKTSTGDKGRGHGMHTMLDLLRDDKSYIRVISGTGDVTKYRNSQNKVEQRLPSDLCGTLVEWSLSLPESPKTDSGGFQLEKLIQ